MRFHTHEFLNSHFTRTMWILSFWLLGFVSPSCRKSGEDRCSTLYHKWTKCLHEQGETHEDVKERFESKETFVENCHQQKDDNLLACARKGTCVDFLSCTEAAATNKAESCQELAKTLPDCVKDLPKDDLIHVIWRSWATGTPDDDGDLFFTRRCDQYQAFHCAKRKSCRSKVRCMKKAIVRYRESMRPQCQATYERVLQCLKSQHPDQNVTNGMPEKKKFIQRCVEMEGVGNTIEGPNTFGICTDIQDCDSFLECYTRRAVDEFRNVEIMGPYQCMGDC